MNARDPLEVAAQWVEVALQGQPWECRDVGEGFSRIERGTDADSDAQCFIATPLPYEEACYIERLLEVARAASASSSKEQP